jgi:hypothetical protein
MDNSQSRILLTQLLTTLLDIGGYLLRDYPSVVIDPEADIAEAEVGSLVGSGCSVQMHLPSAV